MVQAYARLATKGRHSTPSASHGPHLHREPSPTPVPRRVYRPRSCRSLLAIFADRGRVHAADHIASNVGLAAAVGLGLLFAHAQVHRQAVREEGAPAELAWHEGAAL